MSRPSRHSDKESDWRFTAAYRLGRHWQHIGDYVRAHAAYLEAHRRQPRHVPTLYNLAVVQVRLGFYEPAWDTLDTLCRYAELPTKLDAKASWHERAFPVAYQRALIRNYERKYADAASWSRACADKSLRVKGGQGVGARSDFRLPLLTLHASNLVERDRDEGVPAATARALASASDGDPKLDPDDLGDPARIFRYVGHHARRDARTHYNLACFLSRLMALTHEEAALLAELVATQLTWALQDAHLAEWAKRDPALDPIRPRGEEPPLVVPPAQEPEPAGLAPEPDAGAAPDPPRPPVERVPAPRRRATGRLRAIRRARGLLRNVQALTPTNAAVERLADLHRRAEELSERRFGIELAAAVAAAGDPGTVYHLPLSAREKPMALPLVIREVYDPEHGTRFLVAGGAEHLPAGAEVLRWNGVPLARAVELRAARIGAPTPEARRARALASLTHRPAALLARFDEGPVRLDWRDPEGAYETVFEWRPAPEPPAGDISEPWWSLDPLVEALAWARGPVTPVRVDDGHEGPLHLRVHSFRVTPQDLRGVTVDLPAAAADRRPLILDVRGNAGGSLRTADGLLAALGSEAPPPAVQVRATRTAEDLVRAPAPEWLAEIRAARKRGESHTAPLTMARSGPALPPVAGPVVLVVDALTSGAAAYLAARFARERRGPVLSTAGDPGLGGGLTTTVGEDDPSYPGHFSVTFARFAGHEDAPVPIEVRRPRTLDDAEVRDAAAELLKGWR